MTHSTKTISKIAILGGVALAAFFALSIFVHADASPIITTQVKDVNGATVTSALVGASIRSAVQIASSTGPVPQGGVDFNVYSDTSCGGSPVTENNVGLVNGFATSSATTVPAGGLSYKVHYDGDANNIAADGSCQPLSVTSSNVTVSTTLSATTIAAGNSIHDSATLNGETANAGGSATYTVFSDSSCQTPYGGAGNVTVTNSNVPDSPPFQFLNPGTFYWQVVYHGDVNNNAATSTCTSEILTVTAAATKNSPTISTTLSSSSIQTGTSIHDSATLTGETGAATGTVAYKVYTNNSCTTLFTTAGTKNVTNGIVPDSDNVQFNSAGTYYWQAVYSGDQNNNAATSTCTSEVLTVAVAGTNNPPPSGPGTISGTVYNDKNKNDVRDSGEEGLAGFAINLYEGPNFSGDFDPVFKTTTTDGSGNYTFTGLANATYSVEQLVKDGWKQTTDDYVSVVISGGAGVSGRDFGDVQKKDAGKDCKVKENHGKGKHLGWVKHKKDCSDGNNQGNDEDNNHQASSTHGWFKFDFKGKGLHLGWLNAQGNKHDNDDSEDNDD